MLVVRGGRTVAGSLVLTGVLAACSTAGAGAYDLPHGRSGVVIPVAASIDAWGSIVAQLGGTHVHDDVDHHQPGHRPARLRADPARRPR